MRASQQTFSDGHTAIHAIPLPAWWLPPTGELVYTNPDFQAYTGATAQVKTKELLDCLHPADTNILKDILQTRPAENTRSYYRLKNSLGEYRWHCHSWAPRSSSGKAEGFISVLQDIHEFYNREAFYKSRFEEIFNETFQFTGLLDTHGRLLEANKSALEFGGYQLKNILGHYFWQAGWWEQSARNQQRLQEVVQSAAAGNFVRSEEIVYGSDGSRLVVDFSLKPLRNESGELTYLIAEGRDITELRQVRNQLKASENKWRTLVENTPDLIVRHNKQLEYTFVNKAIQHLTGFSPQHFLGKGPGDTALPQAQVQRYLQALRQTLSEKKQLEYATEIQSPQGPKAVLITITPEFNEQQEVESLLVLTRDISELKEKEKQLASTNQKLRLSNFKLRNILDSTNDAICSRDMDLKLLAFNTAYEREYWKAYGRQPQVGQTPAEILVHLPAEVKKLEALWQRALSGETFTILQEFGDKRYNLSYYEVTFHPIFDDRRRQIGATLAAKDVSRERKIEKELKDAREFLILAENIPHIIFTTDSAGRPDYVNQAFYEYTNIQHIDLSAPFSSLFVHPYDLKALYLAWGRSVKNTEGLQQEVRFRYHTGEYRWNLLRFIPLVAAEGSVYKWIGSATDIHEAKVAEEKQRLAAQEFRQLAESLPLIIWTTNARGETNYLNNSWYTYTGLPQGHLSFEAWEKHIHPDDLEQTLQHWEHSVAKKEEYRTEYRLRNKQGEYRWFLGKGTPLTGKQGEVIKWFGSSTDIHDQKEQNKRLWQQNLQLNQLNQYLDNFVHAAAHDLRAPIANMKGLLSLFELAAEDKREHILGNLKISAERLDSTLQGMIQLIEAQNQRLDISQDINLKQVFSETLTDFAAEFKETPHKIDTHLDDCGQFTFILPYLYSIFRNLISNSLKYHKEEEVLHIKLRCRREEEFVVLTYQDNGIGIDLEKYGKNLFRPFKRFTKQASGKGIGMHIVKNMLIKTGGKINVDSSLGDGVTFTLYLRNLEGTLFEEATDSPGLY